jgi:hypothetical protein
MVLSPVFTKHRRRDPNQDARGKNGNPTESPFLEKWNGSFPLDARSRESSFRYRILFHKSTRLPNTPLSTTA